MRVAVRIRPLTSPETTDGAQSAVAVQDELNTVIVGSGASARSFVCVPLLRAPPCHCSAARMRASPHSPSHSALPPSLPPLLGAQL